MTIKDLWLKTTFTGMWKVFKQDSDEETIIQASDMLDFITNKENKNHYLSEKEIKYFDVLPHPFHKGEMIMWVCYEKGE